MIDQTGRHTEGLWETVGGGQAYVDVVNGHLHELFYLLGGSSLSLLLSEGPGAVVCLGEHTEDRVQILWRVDIGQTHHVRPSIISNDPT